MPIFPEDFGDGSIVSLLSESLKTAVLMIDVHDDDVFSFSYEFYREGKKIDSYCSNPDYWGSDEPGTSGVSPEDAERITNFA